MKRIALSNRLYSSSRFCASWERNIELSHTWDFRHCQNVKSHSCYYATFSSPHKISSAILKNNSSVGGVLSRKFCDFVKCSVKIIQIFSFIIIYNLTRYLFICPSITFFLSIYLHNYTRGGRDLLQKSTCWPGWWRILLNMGDF